MRKLKRESTRTKLLRLRMGVLILILCSGMRHVNADRPSGISPQTIKSPNGPVSLKGLGESFSPNLSTGTGNFSVPIQVAPGPLTPEVTLRYVGGSGKGALGMSVDLPVLNIYRTTDKGLPNFDEEDRFAVEGDSINDELVVVNREVGYYRLKNESAFALFIRDVDKDIWTIKFPDGKTAILGQTKQSRQLSSGRPYKWFVERLADLFGREIFYEYFTHERKVYISSISYQLHKDDDYTNQVTFAYEDRPDVYTDFSYGTEVTCSKRMKQIDVYHGERRLRQYQLSYEQGILFSLLSQVNMVGEFGEAMPPLSFEYYRHSKQSGQYVKMKTLPPLEGLVDGYAQFEDVNADGLPDLLVGTANDYRYYENVDGRNWSDRAIVLSNSPDRTLGISDALLADIDGDGFRDVVHKHDGQFRYYPAGDIKKGIFKGYREAVTLTVDENPSYDFSSTLVKMSDLNFDGRVDLLYQKPGTDSMIINRKDNSLKEVYIPELPVDVDFQSKRVQMMDFNGDGILDFIWRHIDTEQGRIRVWYGKGHGRYHPEREMRGVPSGGLDNEYHLQDVNKDGQTDIVRVSGSWVGYYLNRGDGSFTGIRGSFDAMPSMSDTRKLLFADMNGNSTTDVIWLTTDYKLKYLDLMGQPNVGLLSSVDNGMGLVTEIDYKYSTEYAVSAKKNREPWDTPMPNPVPVISEIRTTDSFDKLGLEPTVSQKNYEYYNGYYDGEEREFRGFAKVIGTSNGDEYHDTLVTETHMHVGRNLETLEDEETLKGRAWLRLDRDASGRLFSSVETTWKQKWLCQEELSGIAEQILPTCSNYANQQENKDGLVAIGRQEETLIGGFEGTDNPRWTGSMMEYDAWGSLIRQETYGEVAFSQKRTPGESFDLSNADIRIGADEIVKEWDYIYSVADWRIGLLKESRTYDIDGDMLAARQTYYDGEAFVGLPLGQVSVGLVTRETAWHKQADRWIDAQRARYNSDGKKTATMDANGNVVTAEYDDVTRSLPVKEHFEVESGTLTMDATYDTGFGSVTSVTDFNGNTTRFLYDGLGRLIEEWDPLSTITPSSEYIYSLGDSDNPVSSVTTRILVDRDSSLYREMYQYSDGAGRTRLVKREAEEAFGYIASGWSRLTSRGSISHMYDSFPSPFSGFEPSPATLSVTVSRFDALGRVVNVTPPATEAYGATYTLTEYRPFETRVYDERNSAENNWMYPTVTKVDGVGRVREILKYNDINGQRTELRWMVAYDSLGNISEFTDPGNNTRYYAHDNMGRLVHVDDVNIGTVDYAYDDVGNLLMRTDALGQVQTYEYGHANRIAAVHMINDAHGRPDYSYQYYYDEPSTLLPEGRNLLGKLSQVVWPTGTYQASFDELGRKEREVQTLWDGVSDRDFQLRDRFEQTFRYDAAGKLIEQTLPEGLRLEFTYNERSLVSRVDAGFNGAISELFGGVTYDHRGMVKKSDARNGVRSCSWYDDRSRLISTMSGPIDAISCETAPLSAREETFRHITYEYTPTGLIGSASDLSPVTPGISRYGATYKYNRLYELTNAQTTDGILDYQYDIIQNLQSRTFTDPNTGEDVAFRELPVGTFGYGENGYGPNQITSAGDLDFEYNAIGQMTAYNGFDLQFDIEGRLVKAEKADYAIIEYFYDDLGDKSVAIITRQNSTPRVYRYIFDGYQIRDGKQTWYVKAGYGEAEITASEGLEIDLTLLEELATYVSDPLKSKKPLPAEYMDLDSDGDDDFDINDLIIAEDAYWYGTKVGGPATTIRYYHTDHIGGSTVITDSAGDVISTMRYHPYGGIASRSGQKPIYGFAGGEIEEESELGLIRFGTRWYASAIGRWVSGDFYIGESPSRMASKPLESNLYSYGANNPVMNVDPNGTETLRMKIVKSQYSKLKAVYQKENKKLSAARQSIKTQLADLYSSTAPPDNSIEAIMRRGAEFDALYLQLANINETQHELNECWGDLEVAYVQLAAADAGRPMATAGSGRSRTWGDFFRPKTAKERAMEKMTVFDRRMLVFNETVDSIKSSGIYSIAVVGVYIADDAYGNPMTMEEKRDVAKAASVMNSALEGVGKGTRDVNKHVTEQRPKPGAVKSYQRDHKEQRLLDKVDREWNRIYNEVMETR